ncbi:MAG TPA: toxic anion resistance protein [Candidatus Baltobacteraceae bacterium]|nr:toxic anion resistance protein [Candidatus Baltobacteraceae bacterium]
MADAPVPAPTENAQVPLSPQEQSKLDAQVQGYVGDLASLDIHGEDFKTRISALEQLGNSEISQAASVANRLLDRPMRALRDPNAGSPEVSKGLSDLRATIESLDPAKRDLLSPRRLLGIIPFGNRLRQYFDQYQSAQTHLNAIIESLYRGKDELLRDNAAIEEQKTQLWTLMGKTQAMIYLCKKIDAELTDKIAQLETSDPERAKTVKESALFPVRQKGVDLLTQMAVNVQGYQALDLIKRNNAELVKGVDRATTTTVSALRTAVAVAQALTSQRLVLAQISALGSTTSNMIESTSQMLRDQGVAIYKQAAEPTVQLEQLHHAFENVYAAMDAVEDYKLKAADNLAQTASALEGEVQKAKAYLSRSGAPQLPQ